MLWNIAQLIHQKYSYYNVNIFITDDEKESVVLRAFAGGFGNDLVVGYSLRMGESITEWVAENRQSLVSGDVKNEPRRIQGFGFGL